MSCWRIENRVCLSSQQRLQTRANVGVVAAGFVEKARLFFVIHQAGAMKEFPFPLEIVFLAHIYSREISTCNHARAWRQSRATVPTDTPVTSAISSTVSPPKNRSVTISACR